MAGKNEDFISYILNTARDYLVPGALSLFGAGTALMVRRYAFPPNVSFGEAQWDSSLILGEDRPEYKTWLHIRIYNRKKTRWPVTTAKKARATVEITRDGKIIAENLDMGIGTGDHCDITVDIGVNQKDVVVAVFLDLKQDTNLWVHQKKGKDAITKKGYYLTAWSFINHMIRGPLEPGTYQARITITHSGRRTVSDWLTFEVPRKADEAGLSV